MVWVIYMHKDCLVDESDVEYNVCAIAALDLIIIFILIESGFFSYIFNWTQRKEKKSISLTSSDCQSDGNNSG